MKYNNLNLSLDELVEQFEITPELRSCLDDLEEQINPDIEDALFADYQAFLNGNWQEPLFAPQRSHAIQAKVNWPKISVNKALVDFNNMALQQFCMCSDILTSGAGLALNVRANYGVCISSCWFGCELYMMDDKYDTLPTSLPIQGGSDAIDGLISAGIPDITTGYGMRVYAMGNVFKKIMAQYPKINRYVYVYHPDFQSPIDTCELIWGSDIFLEFYENPERVHGFIDLLTETYIHGIHKWEAIHPFLSDLNAHWNMMHKGNIMLRTDSAMNLSPEMYDEFIRPYEQRCLDACGGGGIHFCGRGDHFIESMTSLRGITSIVMSQPEYNDMEIIYRNTVDKGIPLLGFNRSAAENSLAKGRNLHNLILTVEKDIQKIEK